LKPVTVKRGVKRARKEAEEDEEKPVSACKFYVRILALNKRRLMEILVDFELKHPNNTPFIHGVRQSLSAVSDDAIVYDKYIGQTLANSPEGRQNDDQSSSIKKVSTRWLHRLTYPNKGDQVEIESIQDLAEDVEIQQEREDTLGDEGEDVGQSETNTRGNGSDEDEGSHEFVEEEELEERLREASAIAGFEVFEFIELSKQLDTSSLTSGQVWWSTPALWAIEYCLVLAAGGKFLFFNVF
jgi:hypothetical protein